MTFRIVSTGWECADWLGQTLASVEAQSTDDWTIQVVYDPSADDGAARIREWCDARDARWRYSLPAERRFAVRNQYDAVQLLAPADDDIVVFLDLDGDRLAHRDVLAHLGEYYRSSNALVTYGSYQPVPDPGTCAPAIPFPEGVVRTGAYRRQMMTGVCCFNHLRTMRGSIAKAIPVEQFRFVEGPHAGEWYTTAGDYVFMACALELAQGRYRCIDETLLLYNHANVHADYLTNSLASVAAMNDFLRRPPLGDYPPLPPLPPLLLRPLPAIPEPVKYGYEVTLPDGTIEMYGSYVPAERRAREVGGKVRDAGLL